MNLKFDNFDRLLNPSVQINTAVSAMMRNGTELDETGEPVFDEEGDENVTPLSFFKELDPLTYKSYNPYEVAAARKAEQVNDLSAKSAQNINAVKTL